MEPESLQAVKTLLERGGMSEQKKGIPSREYLTVRFRTEGDMD